MPATKVSAAYVTAPVPLIVCPCCKSPAEIFRTRHNTFIGECSDPSSCKDWPMTIELPSAEAAAEAWNKGEAE